MTGPFRRPRARSLGSQASTRTARCLGWTCASARARRRLARSSRHLFPDHEWDTWDSVVRSLGLARDALVGHSSSRDSTAGARRRAGWASTARRSSRASKAFDPSASPDARECHVSRATRGVARSDDDASRDQASTRTGSAWTRVCPESGTRPSLPGPTPRLASKSLCAEPTRSAESESETASARRRRPSVVRVGAEWIMWYHALDSGSQTRGEPLSSLSLSLSLSRR